MSAAHERADKQEAGSEAAATGVSAREAARGNRIASTFYLRVESDHRRSHDHAQGSYKSHDTTCHRQHMFSGTPAT